MIWHNTRMRSNKIRNLNISKINTNIQQNITKNTEYSTPISPKTRLLIPFQARPSLLNDRPSAIKIIIEKPKEENNSQNLKRVSKTTLYDKHQGLENYKKKSMLIPNSGKPMYSKFKTHRRSEVTEDKNLFLCKNFIEREVRFEDNSSFNWKSKQLKKEIPLSKIKLVELQK